MRILIIDADASLATALRRRLRRAGHVVDSVPDGRSGMDRGEGNSYDALIIAQALPDLDGAAVVRGLRTARVATPILAVTTGTTPQARIQALDAGADDCLSRPFSFDELAARLRAITRRGTDLVEQEMLVVADLVLDRRSRRVTRNDRLMQLAPREFALLEYLMRHPCQVATRTLLLEHVWDYRSDPTANVVDAAIHRLRKVIDAGDATPLIQTVRSVGYRIGMQS